MTPEAKLTEALAKITAMETAAAEHATAITAKDARIAELEAKTSADATALADINAKLTEAGAKLADEQAKTAKLEADAKTAEKLAAEIVAKAGVEPVEIKPSAAAASGESFATMSNKDLAAHYGKLTGKEKEAFFKDHIAKRLY